MIIILEGADGTGKTTLAKALCHELEADYIHATWSRELDCRMLEYHMNILSEAFEKYHETSRPVIIDRLWVSESIYAEVFRHGSRYPWHGRIIEQFINSIGGFTIVCLVDDKEKHKERFEILKDTRKEMYDNVEAVVDLYNTFYYGVKDQTNGFMVGFSKETIRELHDTYLKEVILMGGAGKFHDNIGRAYYRYSIENEGVNLDNFVHGVRAELQRRIHAH